MELGTHIDATERASGRVVLLEGPAGIGKSTLLSHMRPLATDLGLRWYAARGSELERDFPFGIVRQLLEPAVAADPSLLSGPSAHCRSSTHSTSGPWSASADTSQKRPCRRP